VQVTQHQPDIGVIGKTLDRFLTGATGYALITTALEKLAKFFHDQRLIINDKDFYCRGELVHVLLHANAKIWLFLY
jgi:hypothetical protein